MNLKDLTKEQLLLLNTDFGPELEKQASAIVAEQQVKIAELQEVAASCMAYGEELAMNKIAEMEARYRQKLAQEEGSEEEKKGLEKKESEKEEEDSSSEEEKTATAMGNFILEGYWKTLMEKGAEYYGDKNIYIEELVKEAKGASSLQKFVSQAKSKLNKAKGQAMKHVTKNKGKYQAAGAAAGTGTLGYLLGKKRND